MGRGRPRAGSAASADGAFRPAERGAWNPRSSATDSVHILAATGLQSRREGGKVRAQASPNCLPLFPPTHFPSDLPHPQPARWRAGLGQGRRARPRAHEPPRAPRAHARRSTCWRPALPGPAKPTAEVQAGMAGAGGGGRGFLK